MSSSFDGKEENLKKASILKAVGIVATLLMVVLAVFLAVTSMLFSFGGGSAPDIFGYNIYIVSGGDFYQLKSGTAAISQKVWPDEVNNGELIIYNDKNGEALLARVNSSTLKEAVMSFDIESQTGENETIKQSQLIARVNYCSDFWGMVISFAKSPFGVMAAAILPCLAIIVYEIVRFIISKLPTPSVETIKLQEEAPVFLPRNDDKVPEKKKVSEAVREKVLSKPSGAKTYNKTDEFTEHLHSKKNTSASADEVKDRADFSPAAKLKMANDRSEQKSEDEAKKKDQQTPSVVSVVPDKTIENKKDGGADDVPNTPQGSSEPDISLIFKDDEDKKYDIDELLADIEKRRH